MSSDVTLPDIPNVPEPDRSAQLTGVEALARDSPATAATAGNVSERDGLRPPSMNAGVRRPDIPGAQPDADIKDPALDGFRWFEPTDVPPTVEPEMPALEPGDGNYEQVTGRHAVPSRFREFLGRHWARFTSFSVIGGVIFVAGLLLQAALTSGLHVPPFLSYVTQAVVSVEVSFLLNRRLTWRKRGTPFWSSLLRFNAQKTVTVAANLILYAGLLKLGMNYLVANVLLTAVFTVINYVGGDRFVFTPGKAIAKPMAASAVGLQAITKPMVSVGLLPAVSVVIPCKANEKTIRAAVD
jgi:putative flippase GtrA